MSEAQNQAVQTALEALVLQTINVPVKYNFKTVTVTDDEGKPVKEKNEKGEEVIKKTKRPSFETVIPVPTLESIFQLPEGSLPRKDVMEEQVTGKDEKGNDVKTLVKVGEEYAQPEHKAIFEMIQDYLADTGKAIVDDADDNDSVSFPDGTFDFALLSRKPKYERKGGSIQKELLENLCESYGKVMKEQGKPEKGIKIAQHYFMKRAKGLDSVRPEIVQKMQANLSAWFLSLEEADQAKFAQPYELLNNRITAALAEDASAVM